MVVISCHLVQLCCVVTKNNRGDFFNFCTCHYVVCILLKYIVPVYTHDLILYFTHRYLGIPSFSHYSHQDDIL